MALKTTKFDVQDHLKTSEDRAAYLVAAFEEGDSEFIHQAVNDIFQTIILTRVTAPDSPSPE